MGRVYIAQERDEPAEVETSVRPTPPEDSAEGLKSERDDERMTQQDTSDDGELKDDENGRKLLSTRGGGGYPSRGMEWKTERRARAELNQKHEIVGGECAEMAKSIPRIPNPRRKRNAEKCERKSVERSPQAYVYYCTDSGLMCVWEFVLR